VQRRSLQVAPTRKQEFRDQIKKNKKKTNPSAIRIQTPRPGEKAEWVKKGKKKRGGGPLRALAKGTRKNPESV